MPAAVSCVIDAMVVFVLPCCVKIFPIVRQNLNAENPSSWDSMLPPFEFCTNSVRSFYTFTQGFQILNSYHTRFIFYIHQKCTERTCTIRRHAFPKFCAGVQ